MDFNLNDFTESIMGLFINSPLMPNMNGVYTNKYGYTQTDDKKHKNRPSPRDLKKRIEMSMHDSKMPFGEGGFMFDIGNEQLEQNFPYYHILQQAPTIRKAGKGTKKSKGSLANETHKSNLDYERVSWNGKTFTKEYSRNVRGSRVNHGRTTFKVGDTWYNTGANQYLNVHYQYIDKIIREIVPQLKDMYNLKLGKVESSGLAEEYAMGVDMPTDMILDIFGSFE